MEVNVPTVDWVDRYVARTCEEDSEEGDQGSTGPAPAAGNERLTWAPATELERTIAGGAGVRGPISPQQLRSSCSVQSRRQVNFR